MKRPRKRQKTALCLQPPVEKQDCVRTPAKSRTEPELRASLLSISLAGGACKRYFCSLWHHKGQTWNDHSHISFIIWFHKYFGLSLTAISVLFQLGMMWRMSLPVPEAAINTVSWRSSLKMVKKQVSTTIPEDGPYRTLCLSSRAADPRRHQEGLQEVGPGVWRLGTAAAGGRCALLHSIPAGLVQQPGPRVDLHGLHSRQVLGKKQGQAWAASNDPLAHSQWWAGWGNHINSSV